MTPRTTIKPLLIAVVAAQTGNTARTAGHPVWEKHGAGALNIRANASRSVAVRGRLYFQ
jgi:hypothetical protein